jgi:hypothetical protein
MRKPCKQTIRTGSLLGGLLVLALVVCAVPASPARHATSNQLPGYPAPRFPSYLLKKPRGAADFLPYARILARNRGGNQGIGLGYLKKGDGVLIVTDVTADPMVMAAVRQALVELGVKPLIVSDYSLVGVSKEEAEDIRRKTEVRSAQEGYMEAKYYWIEDQARPVWANPAIARDWLKQQAPRAYDALYPKRDEFTASEQAEYQKLKMQSVGAAIQGYLKDHPGVTAIYWGKAGGGFYARWLGPYERNFWGLCTFSSRWEVMSEVPQFPGPVQLLVEKKTLAILPQVDEVHITDPEGTDVSWTVPQEMAKRWADGAYWRGHLLMFPDSATGQNPYSFRNYPARKTHWVPRSPTARLNGVVAGTNGSGGFFPRMEIHFRNGYITEVRGGGLYGDVIRAFLHYPHINDLTYPYYDTPGFWHLWELALGTNPKYFRNPTDFYGGGTAGIYCLTYERYRSGVFHWGFGNEIANGPGSLGKPTRWLRFAAEHHLPAGHDFHIHNYFITYKVRLRATGKWVTLVDKGHLTALDDPDVRALAAHYGNPDRILSEDWIPEVPGINVPGNYQDYARDPWKYANAQMKEIIAGTYKYFYPPTHH